MLQLPLPFADLPSAVGTIIEGEPFALGDQELDLFERATWLDKAYPEDAAEFPEQIIEGFLLLSMLDAVLQFTSSHDKSSMWGLNYGLDRVRFVSQVHVGERIVPRYEVAAVEPKDVGFKVLRKCTFTLEGSGKVAMTADWWSFVSRAERSSAAGAAPDGERSSVRQTRRLERPIPRGGPHSWRRRGSVRLPRTATPRSGDFSAAACSAVQRRTEQNSVGRVAQDSTTAANASESPLLHMVIPDPTMMFIFPTQVNARRGLGPTS